MTQILIGTAAWTDPSLIACGRFYPPQAKTPEARLRFYASRFDMVEVDASYYAMPTPSNAQLWAERTPHDFIFNTKAFRLFTGHQTKPDALPRDLRESFGTQLPEVLYYNQVSTEIRDELWRRFLLALQPLEAAGKLGAVHFQFPPWVRAGRDGEAHVTHCAERLQGRTMAAEFRHRSWFEDDAAAERTLAFERDLGVAHTIVDSPQGFDNTVPCIWEVTNPKLAVMRLHGRNAAAWNAGARSSSGRFDYWYSADELDAMIPEIRHVASLADSMHVVMNTNHEDQGQVNATLLKQLLA